MRLPTLALGEVTSLGVWSKGERKDEESASFRVSRYSRIANHKSQSTYCTVKAVVETTCAHALCSFGDRDGMGQQVCDAWGDGTADQRGLEAFDCRGGRRRPCCMGIFYQQQCDLKLAETEKVGPDFFERNSCVRCEQQRGGVLLGVSSCRCS